MLTLIAILVWLWVWVCVHFDAIVIGVVIGITLRIWKGVCKV